MAYFDRDEWADDHGYSRGRCACGRSTWSDTGVMDCGCGATLDALAEEDEEFEARRAVDLAEQEAEEAAEAAAEAALLEPVY
jgi:hypothetical protein